jgi:hypothetical protein
MPVSCAMLTGEGIFELAGIVSNVISFNWVEEAIDIQPATKLAANHQERLALKLDVMLKSVFPTSSTQSFKNNQLRSPLKPSSEKNITSPLHYLTEFKSCSLNMYAEGIGTWNSYAGTWNATESRLSHLRWFPRPNKLKWVCLSCKQECCVLADLPEAARIRDQRQICGPKYL